MQYKIPVQIENEDPIILGLSLRQLTIIMIWFWIGYSIFKSLEPSTWAEVAFIPAFLIAWIALVIAIFKYSEMTFIPFILAFLRFNINIKERIWKNWVDSYNPLEIWTITINNKQNEKTIDLDDKKTKINSLEDNLNKI